MKAEKPKAKVEDAPKDKKASFKIVGTQSIALHEIEMPYRKFKLELNFASQKKKTNGDLGLHPTYF